MPNTRKIVDKLANLLFRGYNAKKFKDESEFLNFAEELWASAGDKKYDIDRSYNIIEHMLEEYAWLEDYANMRRWLDISDKHAKILKLKSYINNYRKGVLWFDSENEEEAFKAFKACYDENKKYIFSVDKERVCVKAFCEDEGLTQPESGAEEYFGEELRELREWSAFFGKRATFCYDFGEGYFCKRMRSRYEAAVKYVEENQKATLEMILSELLCEYPTIRWGYGYEDDEQNDLMPIVEKVEDFAALLTLQRVHIIPVCIDKFPYIGYEFLCSWDEERDFNVITFKDRVVDMVWADNYSSTEIAKDDRREVRREEKEAQKGEK